MKYKYNMALVKKRNHASCCVVNCKNTGLNSDCKFYSFPTAGHKIQQRERWIEAVQQVNSGDDPWFPKQSHRICSAHFINDKKSEEELSPSYVPTIFQNIRTNEKSAIQRHNPFTQALKIKPMNGATVAMEIHNAAEDRLQIMLTEDAECQVNFYFDCTRSKPEKMFVCNRYIYCGVNYCDSETQTNIIDCYSPL